ncbi:type III secretion system outer membrane ring subunit SctC [Burkholderia pyrrocinia]
MVSNKILSNSKSKWRDMHDSLCACLPSLIIFISLIWVPTASVKAATFPWKDATFSYRAKSIALSRVLEDLFVTQQRPVDVSDAVKEMPLVNGEFRQAPKQVFNDLAQSYGLVGYFDGSKMFVTTLAENKTILKALTKVSARDVERTARQFGYLDGHFGFKTVGAPYTLQLNGPPAYIERVSDLISALEASATPRVDSARLGFRVIALKHAWANDITYDVGGHSTVVRGVASSIRSLIDGLDGLEGEAVRDTGSDVPSLPVTPVQRPVSALGALLGSASGEKEQSEIRPPLPMASKESGRANDGTLRLGQRLGASIRVAGDSRTNSVILMAPVDLMPMLEGVVEDLDVESELVQIEAAIIDVKDGALKEIGFDWSLQGNRFRIASTTSGRSIGQDLGNSDSIRGIGPNLSIFGGTAALNFLSRIQALQVDGKAAVLSRPKLATLNGIEAVITNQQVFYPSISSERVAQLYQVDVGLQMRVVPVVVRKSDGSADIRLQVFIEDGAFSSRQVGGFPVTSKSAITTQAIVRNGESLLIGGYVRDIGENNEAKVPLLGDIPLLGALFRFRSKNVDRQERLFLITPKLLTEDENASQALGTNSRERVLIDRLATRDAFASSVPGSGASNVIPSPNPAMPTVLDRLPEVDGQPSSGGGH